MGLGSWVQTTRVHIGVPQSLEDDPGHSRLPGRKTCHQVKLSTNGLAASDDSEKPITRGTQAESRAAAEDVNTSGLLDRCG